MKEKLILTLSLLAIVILAIFLFYNLSPTQKCIREGIEYYKDSQVFSDLNALVWLRCNSVKTYSILSWWDYGKELENVTSLKAVVKNPSESILDSVACLLPNVPEPCTKEELQPFSSEDEINDVAKFFTTKDENEAVCIAKKYDANYIYVPLQDINKFYWISNALTIEKYDGISYASLNLSQETSNTKIYKIPFLTGTDLDNIVLKKQPEGWVAEDFKGTIYLSGNEVKYIQQENYKFNGTVIPVNNFKSIYIIDEKFGNSMMTKFTILDGYGLNKITKIYENDKVRIFEVNLDNLQC